MAIFTVPMLAQTVVANGTLVLIHSAAALTTRGSMLRVLRWYVDQEGTATSQQLGIAFGTKARKSVV